MRCPIPLSNIGQLEDNPDDPREDLAVVRAVAKDWIELPVAAAVKAAMALAWPGGRSAPLSTFNLTVGKMRWSTNDNMLKHVTFLAPYRVGVFQPDLRPDDLVKDLQDFWMVDEHRGRPARDRALSLWQAEGRVANAEDLIADGGDLVLTQHALTH